MLISGSLTPMKCGVGDYTGHLAAALERLSPGSVAVLTDQAARDHQPTAAYRVFPVVRRWSARDVPAIARAVRQWRPQVIHMQFPTQGYRRRKFPWLLPALFSIAQTPVVQTWHEYYPARSGWKNIFNAIAPGGLIVVRPNYLEAMPSWYRQLVARKHFRLIPNAATLPQVRLTPAERMRIRAHVAANSKRLIAYFGFVYPAKGVEFLTEIANPETDHLVIVADLQQADPYHGQILQRLRTSEWAGRTHVTGFLEDHAAAAMLAAADAVVLPFRDGGGFWNTSVRAARKQGVFVLTTSRERRGYDAEDNTYYAVPGDTAEMRDALGRYSGVRRAPEPDAQLQEWEVIARAHYEVYAEVTGRRAP